MAARRYTMPAILFCPMMGPHRNGGVGRQTFSTKESRGVPSAARARVRPLETPGFAAKREVGCHGELESLARSSHITLPSAS